MQTIKGKIIATLTALIVLLGGGYGLGSVSQNNQYNYSQLTGSVASSTATVNTGRTTLGSVVITEDSAVAVEIWDATSTGAIGNGLATKVADLQAALTEGVYTFDVGLDYGLMLKTDDWTAFAGDWTVTYRQGW